MSADLEGQPSQSILEGLRHAGPLALAGLAANGANVIVTVVIARFLSTHEYGLFAQLIALFLIVSMPGSAVIVAVVRRAAAMLSLQATQRLERWARSLQRRSLLLLLVWVLAVALFATPLSHALKQPGSFGLAAMLTGAGIWVMLCVDRGLFNLHGPTAPSPPICWSRVWCERYLSLALSSLASA
ncbi:MAG: hypothetical protein NT160_01890 [Actinobacteria bacterium]|nr:hypothetical protein [Actinomycetota bacterium]